MAFRFENLKIWHMARAYSKSVKQVLVGFPRNEEYALASQMNRAAHSIALNIAEGSAKKSDKHFDLYLDNAVGSTFEVVSGAFQALDRNYISPEDQQKLYQEGEMLAKAINAFRKTLRFD